MNIAKQEKLHLVILGVIGFLLRFINLGYSNYQGDEIKAFLIPDSGQSTWDFLLTQRKGPVQFVITYFLQVLDPELLHRFIVRLPFALAGFIAIFVFYKLIKTHFGSKVAFYSTFFFTTNGFIVAFSRLIQYQSFVIIFMLLSLYFFSLAAENIKYKVTGIYFGFIFWAISVLSHYDGVFIFPFVAYLLLRYIKANFIRTLSIKAILDVKHILIGFAIFLLMLLLFYIPFILHIDPGTKNYWLGRITSSGSKISSSKYLFTVYQPIYVIHIYLILFFFGLIEIYKQLLSNITLKDYGKTKSKILRTFKLLTLILQDKFQLYSSLTLWFFISFLFLEYIVSIPGTHIYIYLIPAFVFVGLGVDCVVTLVSKIYNYTFSKGVDIRIPNILSYTAITFIFSFIFLQSYFIFVDNAKEYPWENEKFLVWEFHKPSVIFHLSMFGFPYFRDWDTIERLVLSDTAAVLCPKYKPESELCNKTMPKVMYYSTNERESISRYHIPYQKDTDSAGYFVHIKNPQSFTNEILSNKANYWSQNYLPIYTIKRCTYDTAVRKVAGLFNLDIKECASRYLDVADVYYMYPGSLDEIRDIHGF